MGPGEAGMTVSGQGPRLTEATRDRPPSSRAKQGSLLYFRVSLLPVPHPYLKHLNKPPAFGGRRSRFRIPFSKCGSAARHEPSSELEARGERDEQDMWVQLRERHVNRSF